MECENNFFERWKLPVYKPERTLKSLIYRRSSDNQNILRVITEIGTSFVIYVGTLTSTNNP
jgi:hypothetical protein